MFTLAGFEGDGYRVGEIAACPDAGRHFVAIAGAGDRQVGIALDGGCIPLAQVDAAPDCSISPNALARELRGALGRLGVTDGIAGLGTICRDPEVTGVFVEIHDFSLSDSVARGTGDVLRAEHLQGSVTLAIGPKSVSCAQQASQSDP